MHLNRRVQLQLVFFAVIFLFAGGAMALTYLRVPNLLFGAGQYQVTVNLPAAAGLYANANVTYRGTEVGLVKDVQLSPTGVDAVLTMQTGIDIPADLDARVHSQTALGEQFIALVPRSDGGPMLKNGDVIPVDRTTVPADINALLSATNRGLQAIPHDNLKTAIDEAFTAVGGLGPELSRIVRSSTTLAIDARDNLDALTTLIDESQPILDTQIDTSESIQAWAANTAQITRQVQENDAALRGILDTGPDAADAVRSMLDRVQPTLPVLMANLVSVADVAVTYQPNLEQLLVLTPPGLEILQGAGLANRDTKQDYRGLYLSFNLNLNLPPPCMTGYLPAQQRRAPSEVDYPDRPVGDLYCRVPQDSQFNVRGLRNVPCAARPGKRAPTAKMCESEEDYVPLNDGYNWKGDPNATLSGQSVPQPRPETPTPVAIAQYDPNSGTYVGSDGRTYTQSNLARSAPEGRTWQHMLLPPTDP
ncbi:MCE family protein [Mycolicibacterium holsaticum]|uniref:MCE family protein n=1 Tax=Mycolicibacterium holsaticum TaxID=152142 RepID=UPI001C7D4533|nr:MlaD family protein [Mycolicibacterium holsaticum]MDA4110668.1 mammalian cell entry protein [Mycolicibacterium holsaticum DSM 44478 = JCM 12374]QZA14257.1 MCE family protein [Mycolicibacterium holsaticum DSM 44478 = JCM 12374]UNC08291.1 MCE family protein [Mycolicibacterium holsaticum DSM 44478 = JCM 12374]